jgi:hypothetical protein
MQFLKNDVMVMRDDVCGGRKLDSDLFSCHVAES